MSDCDPGTVDLSSGMIESRLQSCPLNSLILGVSFCRFSCVRSCLHVCMCYASTYGLCSKGVTPKATTRAHMYFSRHTQPRGDDVALHPLGGTVLPRGSACGREQALRQSGGHDQTQDVRRTPKNGRHLGSFRPHASALLRNQRPQVTSAGHGPCSPEICRHPEKGDVA